MRGRTENTRVRTENTQVRWETEIEITLEEMVEVLGVAREAASCVDTEVGMGVSQLQGKSSKMDMEDGRSQAGKDGKMI